MTRPAAGECTIGMTTLGITPWLLSQLPCFRITAVKLLPESAIAAMRALRVAGTSGRPEWTVDPAATSP